MNGLPEFLTASIISLGLIIVCTGIFYEVLALVWIRLPRLEGRPRLQIVITMLASFVGHTLAVWVFGICFYALDHQFALGSLKGDTTNSFFDFIYFSAVSYSSLGLGDVAPTGILQLLVGVEALLGLILIGWTITFTYVVAEKYLFYRRPPKP